MSRLLTVSLIAALSLTSVPAFAIGIDVIPQSLTFPSDDLTGSSKDCAQDAACK